MAGVEVDSRLLVPGPGVIAAGILETDWESVA